MNSAVVSGYIKQLETLTQPSDERSDNQRGDRGNHEDCEISIHRGLTSSELELVTLVRHFSLLLRFDRGLLRCFKNGRIVTGVELKQAHHLR